jgi:hypothetical protein
MDDEAMLDLNDFFYFVQVVDRSGFTAAMATMQFAMRGIVADFLLRYPKVNVVAHATSRRAPRHDRPAWLAAVLRALGGIVDDSVTRRLLQEATLVEAWREGG